MSNIDKLRRLKEASQTNKTKCIYCKKHTTTDVITMFCSEKCRDIHTCTCPSKEMYEISMHELKLLTDYNGKLNYGKKKDQT